MNQKRIKVRGVNFSKRESACLKDPEICFNKQASRNSNEGHANLMPKEGATTEGVLYEINDEDIEKLDRFEGYPNHYNKKIIKVILKNGEEEDAIVYIAQPDKIKVGLKPKEEYLNHLKEGKDLISEEYYNFLQSFETLEASNRSNIKNAE